MSKRFRNLEFIAFDHQISHLRSFEICLVFGKYPYEKLLNSDLIRTLLVYACNTSNSLSIHILLKTPKFFVLYLRTHPIQMSKQANLSLLCSCFFYCSTVNYTCLKNKSKAPLLSCEFYSLLRSSRH